MAGARFDVDPSFRAFVRDLGLSHRRVLRRADLPQDILARRTAELTPAQYNKLWDAMDVEAGDRELVPAMAEALSVEHFSPPIFAALCSPDLRVAAMRLSHYKPLIGPCELTVTDLEPPDTGLAIEYRWTDDIRPAPLLGAFELVFWTSLARIGTRERVRPTSVAGPFSPRMQRALEEHLGTKVRPGDNYRVVFSTVDARRPFLTENEQMWEVFAPDLRRRLASLLISATTADRVRAALHETLPAGDPSIKAVAVHLAISARTLQRQLGQERTTFRKVLTSTRADLAHHYLLRQDLRVTEVAFLLGYGDTTSFYRAFRSWTGTTPESLKSQARV